jgi:hypothetical protein
MPDLLVDGRHSRGSATGLVYSPRQPLSAKAELMSDQWSFDGWFYMKAGKRIGPVLPEYIVFLVRAEELRPSEKVFQRWKMGMDYRFTECEARNA